MARDDVSFRRAIDDDFEHDAAIDRDHVVMANARQYVSQSHDTAGYACSCPSGPVPRVPQRAFSDTCAYCGGAYYVAQHRSKTPIPSRPTWGRTGHELSNADAERILAKLNEDVAFQRSLSKQFHFDYAMYGGSMVIPRFLSQRGSMLGRIGVLLKSKTFWGAVLGAGSWLLGQHHVGAVEVGQAIGTVVSAAGLRDAITQQQAK